MNNDTRPTPETDAHIKRMETEDFDVELALTNSFARKIERERNEAREALSGRTVSCEQCNKAAADIADLNQRLIERTADMLAKVVDLEERNRTLLKTLIAREAYEAGLAVELESLVACAVHSCHKDCQQPSCKARRENKAMREAIKEAGKILQSIKLNDIFEETMRNHATYALAKLKPFIA